MRVYWIDGLSRRKATLLAAPYLLLCAVLIVWPLLRLVAFSLGGSDAFAAYAAFFADPVRRHSLLVTLRDSALVAALVVALGGWVAWQLRATDRRWLKLVLSLAVFAPLWMSAITKIFALGVLLQRLGVVSLLLQTVGILHQPTSLLYNEPAVVFGIVYQLLPYGVLPLLVSFALIDLDLIRAAELLGASHLRAVLSVVLPASSGALFATGIMVYLISLGYFLTPVLLGGPASPFIASLIGQDVFQYFDLADAAVSAVLLIGTAGLVVALASAVLGWKRFAAAIAR